MSNEQQPRKPGRPRSSVYRQPARTLAKNGNSAIQIAKELGISTVWVYYLAGDIFREQQRRRLAE